MTRKFWKSKNIAWKKTKLRAHVHLYTYIRTFHCYKKSSSLFTNLQPVCFGNNRERNYRIMKGFKSFFSQWTFLSEITIFFFYFNDENEIKSNVKRIDSFFFRYKLTEGNILCYRKLFVPFLDLSLLYI